MGFTNMLCIAIGAPILQPLIGFLLKWNAQGRGFENPTVYSFADYSVALTPLPICLALSFIVALFVKETSPQKSRG